MPKLNDKTQAIHLCAAISLLLCTAAVAEPDEDKLGKSQNYPVATNRADFRTPVFRVGTWSNIDQVPNFATRVAGNDPAAIKALPKFANPPTMAYTHRNLRYSIQDYLDKQRTTGLLIMKNGQIVAEHYRYGRNDTQRFFSFSMSKSLLAMLYGVALEKKIITSLDDLAEKYVPELAGSAYGQTSLLHLMRMSSGIKFTERYDGTDDIARLGRALAGGGSESPVAVLRSLQERHSPAGEKFVYASGETAILGMALSAAAKRNLSELTSEWIWKPIGAERDGLWALSAAGQEQAMGGFAATLRDWGRLGMLIATDGKVGDSQVIPKEYLLNATDAAKQPRAFAPKVATNYLGYGYQIRILPMRERTIGFTGIHGQWVYVQPSSGIVMVHTAVFEHAGGAADPAPHIELDALWRGVLTSLGGSTRE
ncbi:MAG: class A beta-lactamase-related serine hydrolase [Burkholderiales bacterium]|nr:MAG: class A beta-lactamase-related serine hydrolase [Burkholderiales bacterium]